MVWEASQMAAGRDHNIVTYVDRIPSVNVFWVLLLVEIGLSTLPPIIMVQCKILLSQWLTF